MQPRMNALIMAGSNPADPGALARAEGVASRALIEVGSRPMVARVADAVRGSPRVAGVAVLGLPAGSVALPPEVIQLPAAGDLMDNLTAGLRFWAERQPADQRLFILGADTPLITPEIVTWFLDACQPADRDIYYGIVRRETVMAHFPDAHRSWLRTRDGRYCGADLFLAHIPTVLAHETWLRSLTARRKHVLAELRMVGWGWVVRLLLGQIRLWELRAAVERLLALRAGIVVLPFADIAMDVDKASDLAAVRHAAAQRRAGAPA